MPTFPVIQQDQYGATADTQCITVIIPDGDEYKALLAGMLQFPANILNYADPDSVQAEGVSASWYDAIETIDWDNCMNGSTDRILLFPTFSSVGNGNAAAYADLANQAFGRVAQSPAAINDSTKQNHVHLRPGTWDVTIFAVKQAASGTLRFRLANTTLGITITPISAWDLYSAGTLLNQANTASFTVTTDAQYTAEWAVTTKNPSSTGYSALLSVTQLVRTGD